MQNCLCSEKTMANTDYSTYPKKDNSDNLKKKSYGLFFLENAL